MSTPEEWIRDKADNDPKFRMIAEDARIFGELMEQRGWQRLLERMEKEEQEYLLDVAKRLRDGFEVSQREIDFMAGFWKGAIYVLRHPQKAEQSFEKAARLAWVFESSDQEVEHESPYS